MRPRTSPVPRDVAGALDALGIDYVIAGDEAKALCPAHEDHSPSWSVNLTTGKHNCLSEETKVLTWDGYRPISQLSESNVRVLTVGPHGSRWVTVPFKSYGVQRLSKVTVRRNGVLKDIYATDGHRWFVRGSGPKGQYWSERTTATLIPGHRLRSAYLPRSGTTVPSPWGVAHGFTYGDGTRTPTGTRAVMWGEKDSAIAKFFPLSPQRTLATPRGVPGVEVAGLPRFFKELPSLDESASYLYGWLAGYFAADGCVDSSGMPMLNSASRDDLEFVRNVCIRLGITSYGITAQERTGLGTEPSTLYRLTFARSTLSEAFFLIDEHRSRWVVHRKVTERLGWVVVSVEPTDRVEKVYCAEVPVTHNFVLEDSIVTGNCFSCGFGGSFQLLVSLVQDIHYTKAGTWIRERKVRDAAVGVEVGPAPEKRKRVVTEADLYRFQTPPFWACTARHFNVPAAEAYGILWDADNKYWITPIREPFTGNLWGWQEKAQDGRHFLNVPRDVAKSRALFGFQSLAPGGTAVLVESPLDVAHFRTAGIMGAVSSYGVHVSDEQISLLVDRCSEVVLALDNDAAGRRETERLTAELPGRIRVHVFNYGNVATNRLVSVHGELDGRDPGDLGRVDLTWGKDNATPAWRTRFA